jgi:hypothetical protein
MPDAAPTCLDKHAELPAAEAAAYIAVSFNVGVIILVPRIRCKNRSTLPVNCVSVLESIRRKKSDCGKLTLGKISNAIFQHLFAHFESFYKIFKEAFIFDIEFGFNRLRNQFCGNEQFGSKLIRFNFRIVDAGRRLAVPHQYTKLLIYMHLS